MTEVQYAVAEPEEKYKLCSTAHTKVNVVKSILAKHAGSPTLVIGAYIDQLEELGRELDAPVIQGSTKNKEREALFDRFRSLPVWRPAPLVGALLGFAAWHRYRLTPALAAARRTRSAASRGTNTTTTTSPPERERS